MRSSFTAMLALRIAMILSLLFFAWRGSWDVISMHVPIFLVTLPLIWLGKKDDHYYWLDAAIMFIFLAAMMNTLFFSWPDYHSLFSYDKIFHAAGGAWVAALAAVALRKHITNRWAFCACVIAVAVAIGGLWEVFEWILSILPAPWTVPSTGLADSMMDIIADTAGALLVSSILFLRRYV